MNSVKLSGSGWPTANPFLNYKVQAEKGHRVFLTEEELSVMVSKESVSERLEQVRHIFLFSC